ncbi:MAG: response regulator receiver protein [Verrucomicrobiales bacterium]|nr:response regulator receiver protein [Verrucomicrobiales bacterium]
MFSKDRDLTILIAEDDENDIHLLERALRKNGITNPVQVCRDGEEAINYLRGIDSYADRTKYPFPSVIFLDLKMPRKSGLDVLSWLKAHSECSVIPAIMLTSSREESDIAAAYKLGANSYIVKPLNFEKFQEMIKTAYDYWGWCEKPNVPPHC